MSKPHFRNTESLATITRMQNQMPRFVVGGAFAAAASVSSAGSARRDA
jgi:hypothetical protein